MVVNAGLIRSLTTEKLNISMFIKNLVINIGHLQIDTSNSFHNIAMFNIQNHPLPRHFHKCF